MSDRWRPRACIRNALAKTAVFLLVTGLLGGACADELQLRFERALEDPLGVHSEALDKGIALPGNSEPPDCSEPNRVPSPVSLADAIDSALCNNQQIKQTWAAIKVQEAAVGVARAAYLPVMSVTANRQYTDTTYPDAPIPASSVNGNAVYGSLNWRLFDFGTREANRQSANSLLLAALKTHDATLQKTLAVTVQAYFDAHIARATWRAKVQGEEIAQSTLDSAKRREAGGAVARSDTLQASTAWAKALLEKNRALGSYQKAISVLTYAMGLTAGVQLDVADEQDDAIQNNQFADRLNTQAADLDAWLNEARQSHPAILAAHARWTATQANVAATRAEGLPTVDFSANYNQNGYPGQGLATTSSTARSIGISVTIPIFDGFAHTYKVKGALAQAEQKEHEWLDTQQNVLMEIVKAHADAASSLQSLQASLDLLNSAQEALATAQRKYAKGASDILEVLSTQGALADATQERIRCLGEWRSARLRLLASAGILARHSSVEQTFRY